MLRSARDVSHQTGMCSWPSPSTRAAPTAVQRVCGQPLALKTGEKGKLEPKIFSSSPSVRSQKQCWVGAMGAMQGCVGAVRGR